MNQIQGQEISASLEGLALGAPQIFRNLALFPLLAADEAASDYLLLDEAIERKLARITEVSAGGSVPELAFENLSDERILLVDGDELIGAKQNRIINLSILVGGGRRIVIPVSCVEQGRWHSNSREFSSAGRAVFRKARASKMSQVSASMRETGKHRSDQGEIWKDVEHKVRFSRVASPTVSMSDAYDSLSGKLDDSVRAFQPQARQHGAVVAIDGKVSGLEIFDSAAAFAKYLPKLVRSYAMDAIESEDGVAPAVLADKVQRFIDEIKSATAERFSALGEGEDIRLSGKGIAGGALAEGGRLVHLAGYAVSS